VIENGKRLMNKEDTDMVKKAAALSIILLLLLLFVSCGESTATTTPTTTPQPTVTIAPEVIEALETLEPVLTAVPESATAEEDESIIQPREPNPTATPGLIATEIDRRFGQPQTTSFLGMDTADWVNLLISLIIVAIAFLLGTWLIYWLLAKYVQRTQSTLDNQLYEAIRSNLRWLVVVITLRFATIRLVFLDAGTKVVLLDLYFVLLVFIGVRITWKLIDVLEKWYRARSVEMGNEAQLAPAIGWLVRLGHVVIVLTALIILLSHFGVDVLAFAAALGLTGFAISLAAKDTISDVIAGMIIMVDQPFRVGDRIQIQDENTWGDVSDIGLRTTRIRTRDNRLVIVPNSIIGTNQVVNYTFPDPNYRIQTHVGIPYGTDIISARKIMIDVVRQVEGVLEDKPVEALYIDMTNWAMVFRVRWWIESYADTRRMFDKVHSALQEALDEAGIEIPNDAFDVNLKVDRNESSDLIEEN
jgi:small-conductance mechanosensitive channel